MHTRSFNVTPAILMTTLKCKYFRPTFHDNDKAFKKSNQRRRNLFHICVHLGNVTAKAGWHLNHVNRQCEYSLPNIKHASSPFLIQADTLLLTRYLKIWKTKRAISSLLCKNAVSTMKQFADYTLLLLVSTDWKSQVNGLYLLCIAYVYTVMGWSYQKCGKIILTIHNFASWLLMTIHRGYIKVESYRPILIDFWHSTQKITSL